MKSPKLILLLAVVTLTAVSCGSRKETPKEEAPKMLVLYYSQTGNTKAVAQEIANKLGADIEEITMVDPYARASVGKASPFTRIVKRALRFCENL